MTSLSNAAYHLTIWTARFIYVNILWLGFTILGLGVIGFFPATVAMFSIVRQWVAGEKEIDIFPLFWETYRKEIKKANIVGYILAAIGYILIMEFRILQNTGEVVYLVASFGVIALLALYFILLLYLFPIYVHFNLKVKDYLKWPLIIGILHPILTIFLTLILLILYTIAIQTFPILVVFFGGSLTAFIVTWGVSRTFSKYEENDTAEA